MAVSRMYGGIDDDIRGLFFALTPLVLSKVFDRYEDEYGTGKRKYAEATFEKWRIGTVQMGGEISERLVCIVPPFLTFEHKYRLIEKLWNRLRTRATINVTVSPDTGLDAAIDAVLQAIDLIGDQQIPSALAERLEWLTSDDALTAQALLEQVAKREGEVITQTLESELRQILAVARHHHDKDVDGRRTVNLPAATVNIHVKQSEYPLQRNRSMTDGHQNSPDAPDNKSRDLAPIRNPNDLMGEALRRMSPEKQEEIVGKATDEALRLQVKEREGRLDHEMAMSKVETAAQAAERFDKKNVTIDVSADHRSEHGSVQIRVQSKKPPVSERIGGCFVATACYGCESHQTVLLLRDFRDQWLRHRPAGRSFIAWYYRNGPRYARLIANSPTAKLLGRSLIAPLAVIASYLLSREDRDDR